MKWMRSAVMSFCIAIAASAAFAEDYLQVAAAMHISSNVSDGKYSLAEIMAAAKSQGIQVVIVTDRDLLRWEYGLWPLQGILKKTLSQNSIFTYGIQRYLDDIETLNRYNPDCIMLPAVESAPFYFWQGSVFKDNLVLKNWHVHMLAVGLQTVADFSGLPVAGNAGDFDQYHGDQGAVPYQRYIEYVRAKGGMSFWVHPQVANSGRQGTVGFQTDAYLHLLRQTSGYQGIAVFNDAYDALGRSGGMWDQLLGEYCRGERVEPVWAVAGLGYDRNGDLSSYMQGLRLVLLMRSFTRQEALASLREGRCYAASGADARGFVLDEFSVADANSNALAIMGETLACSNTVRVRIRGRLLRGQGKIFKIQLISDTGVKKVFDSDASEFDLCWEDAVPQVMSYYRLVIESGQVRVVTNPIFLKPGEQQ